MRRFYWLALGVLCVAVLSLRGTVEGQASNTCVALVLDDSGSMAENDPNFLRNAGARLLIAVLDDGDRVGIVRFADSAERLSSELVTLQSPADKQRLFDLLQDHEPDGYTDMKAGLAEARALLIGSDCETRAVLLLSDGQPELPDGLPDDYVPETLALGQELAAPIYGIALTPAGESGLLYDLSRLHEDGRVVSAADASALIDAYLDVIAHLKDRTVVAAAPDLSHATAPGTLNLPLDPALAPYVDRATLLLVGAGAETARWLAPGGSEVSVSDPFVSLAFDDPTFRVITVDNPPPGNWQAIFDAGAPLQARLILRSRLRVAGEMPAVHPLGEPLLLAARLIEAQIDGGSTTLIGQGTFSAEILRPDGSRDAIDQLLDDGNQGDAQPMDGVYSFPYVRTDLPGVYEITLLGYKGVVPARQTVRVTVTEFPDVEIVQPPAAVSIREEAIAVSVRLSGGAPPSLDSGGLTMQITDPLGETSDVLLEPDEEATTWSAAWRPAIAGEHTLRALPERAFYKGVPFVAQVEKQVLVTIVPVVQPQVTDIDLGIIERSEIEAGIAIQVPLTSSSGAAEPITVTLANLTGLAVVEQTPERAPAGSSVFFLTVQGTMQPGSYEGLLLLAGRDGVEIPQRQIRLMLHIYQPALTVSEQELALGRMRVDRQGREPIVETVTITSASEKEETIDLQWIGPEGMELQPESITVPAGETVKIPLSWEVGGLAVQTHEGLLTIAGREGLQIFPGEIPVTIAIVEPPWCSSYCLPLGGLAVGAVLSSVALAHTLRQRPRPWGTLSLVSGPAGHSCPASVPVRTGFRRSGEMLIGSGSGNDFRLVGGGVQARHAAIAVDQQTTVEKLPGRWTRPVERTRRVNLVKNLGNGIVRINGAQIQPGQMSTALAPGARVQIGEFQFVWRG